MEKLKSGETDMQRNRNLEKLKSEESEKRHNSVAQLFFSCFNYNIKNVVRLVTKPTIVDVVSSRSRLAVENCGQKSHIVKCL